MRVLARRLAWLLPLVLCGCVHGTNQAPPMQALAPPLDETPPPPDIAPGALPAPVYNIPKTPEPVAIPPEPVKTTPKHHKPASKAASSEQPNAAPSPPSGQVAEAAPPAEVSAGGSFSTPEEPDSKKQMENSIAEIERGLNSIGRKLSDQEEKTSMQIREFLKQARTALGTGDIEGAKNLATKARALLGELSQ
jgi:hypothetical protein